MFESCVNIIVFKKYLPQVLLLLYWQRNSILGQGDNYKTTTSAVQNVPIHIQHKCFANCLVFVTIPVIVSCHLQPRPFTVLTVVHGCHVLPLCRGMMINMNMWSRRKRTRGVHCKVRWILCRSWCVCQVQ